MSKEVAQILLDAADLIETYGWVQGRLGTCEVGFCITGALRQASQWGIRQGCGEAQRALHRSLGGMNPSTWNDVPGRTKEEVIAQLRKAAS